MSIRRCKEARSELKTKVFFGGVGLATKDGGRAGDVCCLSGGGGGGGDERTQ
jgi:hypothetical protein